MNLLSIEHLSKSYSRRQLFDDTSFFLQEGEKVGIIGINGTGKSTLLKIMAGLEETDEGTVTKANHAVIAYLPQHPVFDPEMTALDCVLAGHRERSGPESGQAEKRDQKLYTDTHILKQPLHRLPDNRTPRLKKASCL